MKHPFATWKITIEFDGSDTETNSSLTISTKGDWGLRDGQRAVDDCIALSMADIMRMLHASGHLVRAAGPASAIEAFKDGWS